MAASAGRIPVAGSTLPTLDDAPRAEEERQFLQEEGEATHTAHFATRDHELKQLHFLWWAEVNPGSGGKQAEFQREPVCDCR